MGTIAVVGSINQDLRLRIDVLPQPGETILADRLDSGPGGKGANQAVAITRGGGRCDLIGAVGDDDTGHRLLQSLSGAGVGLEHVCSIPDTKSGTAVVMVDSSGENAIVVTSGANKAVNSDHVTRSLLAISDLSTVLTQAELSTECITAAAQFAATAGIRFILNLAPYRAVSAGILKLCDPLIVNEIEASALAAALGITSETHATLDRTSLVIELARRCQSVIITLGGDGALYSDGSLTGHLAAPKVSVLDTTGAGDAFVGAVTAQLSETDDLAEGCSAGIRAGSAAVQYEGAQP
jgi:ribokinase